MKYGLIIVTCQIVLLLSLGIGGETRVFDWIKYFFTEEIKSRISSTFDKMVAGPWGQKDFFELVRS